MCVILQDSQLYHLTHGIGRSCINGVFMKVYQTQSLSACYGKSGFVLLVDFIHVGLLNKLLTNHSRAGCDRMGVIEFPRPADFVNRGYVINSARLDMFKHW